MCVTEGLLHTLSWDEIQGVLAHELAHVRNRDILIGSVAAAVAMGITFVASIGAVGAHLRRGPGRRTSGTTPWAACSC